MRTLLVATGSAHKLAELRRLFGPLPFDLRTLADEGIVDEAPEDGATFAENAVAKARFYAAESGLFTLADDSGLEVEALGGAPGVSTRRYAGPNATDAENIEKLLAALRGLPPERRGARFVCTMAIVDPRAQVQARCTEGANLPRKLSWSHHRRAARRVRLRVRPRVRGSGTHHGRAVAVGKRSTEPSRPRRCARRAIPSGARQPGLMR